MDSKKEAYEKPEITDFGSLERLTADCGGGTNGDAAHPGSGSFGKSFTDSHGVTCTSN
jgi:hypothetical protein